MKKVIIAFFLVIIMLMVPISSVGKTVNFNVINLDEDRELYMTEEEYVLLDKYMDNNLNEDEKNQADAILDDILISHDLENKVYIVNATELHEALEEFSYSRPIPFHLLTKENTSNMNELRDRINEYWVVKDSVFSDFIKKIIELIKPRLGWMYDLFYKGGVLLVDGINLAIDFINQIQLIDFARPFALIFNLIFSIPILYFSEALKLLFPPDPDINGFIRKISDFTDAFTTNLSILLDQAEFVLQELEKLGFVLNEIIDYVSSIGDFVDWILGEPPYTESPWEKEIIVAGSVKTWLTDEPHIGLDVTCRGITTTTDSTGKFEFSVEPSGSSSDSIPQNSYYGLHSCVITVSKNDKVLKQTPKFLSYVFSDGEISWPFKIPKSKDMSLSSVFAGRFNNIFLQIRSLFPFFFKNINRYSI